MLFRSNFLRYNGKYVGDDFYKDSIYPIDEIVDRYCEWANDRNYANIIRDVDDIKDEARRNKAWNISYSEASKRFNVGGNKIDKLLKALKIGMAGNESDVLVVSVGEKGLKISDTNKISNKIFEDYLKSRGLTANDVKAQYQSTASEKGHRINFKFGDEIVAYIAGR